MGTEAGSTTGPRDRIELHMPPPPRGRKLGFLQARIRDAVTWPVWNPDDAWSPLPSRCVAEARAFAWTFRLQADDAAAEATETEDRAPYPTHEVVSGRGAFLLVSAGAAQRKQPWWDARRFRGLEQDPTLYRYWPVPREPLGLTHLRFQESLARHRSAAIEASLRRIESMELAHPCFERIPCVLHEAVLEAASADATGRFAAVVRDRPPMIAALGIALGDRVEGWVREGELAEVPRALVEGRKDRDVLALAIATQMHLDPTDARVSRLRSFGKRTAFATERLAMLGAVLDVDVPKSWLPTDAGALEAWAAAQLWAADRGLDADGRLYAARNGVELAHAIGCGSKCGEPALESVIARALRADAVRHLRERIAPETLLARAAREHFPPTPGLVHELTYGGYAMRRLANVEEIDQAGRRFENCLAHMPARYVDGCVRGEAALVVVEAPDGSWLAHLTLEEGSWQVRELARRFQKKPSAGAEQRVRDALARMWGGGEGDGT